MTVEEYNRAVNDIADNLYRFVVKNLRDSESAHDIVQEAYEKLWVKLETVSADKVKSYLFTTAYHTMIDFLRKSSRFTELETVDQGSLSHEQHYSDIQEILNSAIGKLPDDQRSVLMLRDYEGYSYREISEITGLSESQVKVYIYRARVFLKGYIGEMEKII